MQVQFRTPTVQSDGKGEQDTADDDQWQAVLRLPDTLVFVTELDVDPVQEEVADQHRYRRTNAWVVSVKGLVSCLGGSRGHWLTESDKCEPSSSGREVISVLQDRRHRRRHDVEVGEDEGAEQRQELQNKAALEHDPGPHDRVPYDLPAVAPIPDVKLGPERGVARFLPQPGGPALEDGYLVRLPEARQEHDLAGGRKAGTHPQRPPPTGRLCNGAGDGRADGAADERSELDDAHGRAALLRDEHVADDGRTQDVGRHREAGQGTRGDDGRRCLAQGGEHGEGDEEHVRGVHDGVPPEYLGQWRDEQGAGGFTKLPDSDQQDAGRAGGLTVTVEVVHYPVGDRHY